MENMKGRQVIREIDDSNKLRIRIAEMIFTGGEGHIPSSFSIVDILKSVYSSFPDLGSPNSDTKFVLSKGHGSAALYVVLNSCGLLPNEYLVNYGRPGSELGGHPERKKVPAIEASTGSLGHGFPFAVGMALSSKIAKGSPKKIVVLLGDGECQEGTIWEAASIASNQRLGNILAIVDWNGSAAQLQAVENLDLKWKSFGWNVIKTDGHNTQQMMEIMMQYSFLSEIPTVIIAKTTKGKGVSFLEGHGVWHHKLPNEAEMIEIRRELSE